MPNIGTLKSALNDKVISSDGYASPTNFLAEKSKESEGTVLENFMSASNLLEYE